MIKNLDKILNKPLNKPSNKNISKKRNNNTNRKYSNALDKKKSSIKKPLDKKQSTFKKSLDKKPNSIKKPLDKKPSSIKKPLDKRTTTSRLSNINKSANLSTEKYSSTRRPLEKLPEISNKSLYKTLNTNFDKALGENLKLSSETYSKNYSKNNSIHSFKTDSKKSPKTKKRLKLNKRLLIIMPILAIIIALPITLLSSAFKDDKPKYTFEVDANDMEINQLVSDFDAGVYGDELYYLFKYSQDSECSQIGISIQDDKIRLLQNKIFNQDNSKGNEQKENDYKVTPLSKTDYDSFAKFIQNSGIDQLDDILSDATSTLTNDDTYRYVHFTKEYKMVDHFEAPKDGIALKLITEFEDLTQWSFW